VELVSDRIIEYARGCMYNEKRASPFQKAAAMHGNIFAGGKLDDITLVVALVREVI